MRQGAPLAAFAVVLGVLVAIDPPLGHDEAVYAMGGRALVEGGPASGFEVYRPAGMAVIAAPGVVLGGAPWALRLVPACLTVALLAAAWAVARRWTGSRAGGIVVVATLTWPHLAWRGAMLLSDVPSTLACLGMAWWLVELVRGERPWRAAVLAGLCAAVAFWLRYGAVIAIVTTTLAVLVAWRREAWARRGAVAGCAIVLAVAFAPFVAWSVDATGSPLGILERARDAAGQRHVGDGLVYYARTWFTETAGPVMGALAIAGIVATFVRATPLRRALGVAAVTQLVWLGLTAHGEPRFVLFPVLLLTIVGAEVVAELAMPKVLRAGAVLSVVTAAVVVVMSIRAMRDVAAFTGPMAAAGAAVARDAGGARCRVVTRHVPQVAYYSRCEARPLRAGPAARRMKDGAPMYVVDFGPDPEVHALLGRPDVSATVIDGAGWRVWRATRTQ